MRKRENSAKASRAKTGPSKKSTHKARPKSKVNKEEPETYIMLGDNFYVAATHTERHNYQ